MNPSRYRPALMVKSRLYRSVIVFFIMMFVTTGTHALAQSIAVVDANVPANGCTNAWPAEILGNYNPNGTNNGRTSYAGPNGYWLYHANTSIGNAWVVGQPKGTTDINAANVRHFILSTATTPPLNTNFSYASNGCGTIKLQDGGAPPPAAPTLYDPYSGTVTATTIDLSWSQINNATRYRIDVSTSSSFGSFVSPYNNYATPTGSPYAPTTFTLTGLTPGTTFYIRIRSENGSGQSANSNTVNATTIPSAPSATAATPIDDQSFQANWNAQSGASYYKLYVSPNSGFSSYVSGYNGTTVSATSRVVSGLTAGATYYYRIRAVNSFGESGYSNTISTLTGPPVPTVSAPTGITASGFTANWGTSSGATGYRLDVSTSSGFSSFVSGYNNRDMGTAMSATLTGLTGGTTYYYRVRAYNATSPSGNSATESALLIPAAPVTIAATGILQDSFTANWNASTGATGYRLDVSEDSGFGTFLSGFQNLDVGNVTSQSVTGLSAYTMYYYRVRAYNATGTSTNSNTTSVQTDGAPAAATTQAVSGIQDKAATGNGTITDLGIPTATEHGVVWNTSGSPDVSTDPFTSEGIPSLGTFSSGITGLLPGNTYHVRAYVTNSVGPAYGNEVTFTTLAPSLSIAISPSVINGNCGSDTSWTVTVTNNGPVNADVILIEAIPGAWLDPNLSSSSTGLTDLGGGTFAWEFNNLGSGASQSFTLTATLNPDGSPSQDDCADALRQVNVRADWGAGTTGEAVDGNPATRAYDKLNGSWSTAGPATVNMPNLIATAITPATSCSGDGNLSGTISVTVQNTGTAPAAGPFTVQVTDGKGWTGTGSYAGTLAAGATDTVDVESTTWAVTCHDCADPYSMNATVDLNNDICECDESDNDYGPTSYSVELPDLSVTTDSLSVSCSGDGEAQLSGALTIANTSCGDFSGDVPIQLTVFDNTDCTGTVRSQWTETLTGVNINAGGTSSVSISAHNWSTEYYEYGDSCQVSVSVELDFGDTICECDGTNNSYCASPLDLGIPDLQPTTDTLSVDLTSEDTLTVTGEVTVANWGCVSMNDNLDVRFTLYAGGDETAPVVDQWTETFSSMAIAENSGMQPVNLTPRDVVLADGIPGGTCDMSIFVELDYSGAICETSSSNNDHLYTGYTVNGPDVVVEGQALEITCDSSGPDTIQGTVTLGNNGCTVITGDVDVSFTLTDQWGCTGSILHSWTETFSGLNIAPSSSAQLIITPEMAELNICSAAEPSASAYIVADPSNLIMELNGHNNENCADIILQHLITATAGENGLISPGGPVMVTHGLDQTFQFHPDDGYHVEQVYVDANPVEERAFYLFRQVSEDHTIHVTFAENIPPVIDSFTRNTETGDAPLVVQFLAEAHDPDGGRIMRYEWEITGRRREHRTSYAGDMAYRFVLPGEYAVQLTVVDDEGETAQSAPMQIMISESGPVAIPIPDQQAPVQMKIGSAQSETHVLNPFSTETTIHLSAVDPGGIVVGETDQQIPAFGFVRIDNMLPEAGDDVVRIASGSRTLHYLTRFKGPHADTAAGLSSTLSSRLYLPHIAEETDQWDTTAYVSRTNTNPNLFGSVTVNGDRIDFPLEFQQVVDLEPYLTPGGESAISWGRITAGAHDPFSDTNVLSGMEIFAMETGDGAAVRISPDLYTTLYIPHIPAETDTFWTGFTLINPHLETVAVQVRLFTDNGEPVGTYELDLPPQSKRKGLLEEMFPGASGLAVWGIMTASQPIQALEIFGTDPGGICGFSLSGLSSTHTTLGLVDTSPDYWTGISLTNPNPDPATATLLLTAEDGQTLSETTLTIPPMSRITGTLESWFDSAYTSETATVRVNSDMSIVALSVVGDIENSRLAANPAVE